MGTRRRSARDRNARATKENAERPRRPKPHGEAFPLVKRTAVCTMLALLATLTGTPVRASALMGQSARGAIAAWWEPRQDGGTLRSVAFQEHLSNNHGLLRFAVVATAACGVRNGKPSGCRDYRIKRVELTPEQFKIDPLLQSARVSFRLRGQRFAVKWTATGDLQTGKGHFAGATPYPDGAVGAAGGSAGLSRNATANGTGFGLTLNRQNLYAGTIAQGGNAFGIICVRVFDPTCSLP